MTNIYKCSGCGSEGQFAPMARVMCHRTGDAFSKSYEYCMECAEKIVLPEFIELRGEGGMLSDGPPDPSDDAA